MSEARGQVVIGGTRRGVPNLVLELVHVQHGAPASGSLRLGSGSTDRNGQFSITYGVRGAAQGQRNLMLRVLTPEGPGRDGAKLEIYRSVVRENAAEVEEFVIELTEDAIDQSKLTVALRKPLIPTSAVSESHSQEKATRASIDTILADSIRSAADRAAVFTKQLRPTLAEHLSTVTDVERTSIHYFSETDTVQEKFLPVLREDLKPFSPPSTTDEHASPLRTKVGLALTPDHIRQLSALSGDGSGPIT